MARSKQSAIKGAGGHRVSVGGKIPRKAVAFKKTKKALVGGKIPRKDMGASGGGIKKPHRFRPGTVALRQIRKYQKSTDLLMRKAPFIRLVRDIADSVKVTEDPIRFTGTALGALQHTAEDFLIELLDDTNTVAITCGKVTIMPKHMQCVKTLRDSSNERLERINKQKAEFKEIMRQQQAAAYKSALAPDDDGDDESLIDADDAADE